MSKVQLSLFTNPTASLEVCEASVKEAMASVAAASRLSREQGCDRMNGLAEVPDLRLCTNAKRLSTALFEKWLNKDAEQMPSIKAVQVFCCVYQSSSLWEALLSTMGKHVLGSEDMHFYKVGKDLLEYEQARKKLKSSKDKARELL